ncbi:alpha/beta hydrolase [Aquihabitans sp. G128]|uniref:alpha/beta hydrolase n=1 Tax=Aquihabitans sp. G128 TaxID=2849779 RepID=UPI001C2503C7|nr:alpha/beta hydrolase [Aquihabitans sp. G128]QXC61414.1 alpha/beta hydrolase [Aquihabitans sp. G128]
MTDLIRAQPLVLAAYTHTATTAIDAVDDDVTTYASAWSAFAGSTFSPSLSVPSDKAPLVRALLDRLTALDREPGLLAQALRDLDADGDGALTEADGIDAAYLQLRIRNQVLDPAALTANDQFLRDAAGTLVTVVRDGSDGNTRVLKLNVDDHFELLETLTPAQLQAILELYGLTGVDGPLHIVAHGLSTDTAGITSAANNVADQYDNQGIDGATVLAIDWDAGEGLLDWDQAHQSAKDTGDHLAPLFTAIAASNPDATVAITAHSLGNHVMLRALSQMDDPIEPGTEPFTVDYTGVQPAIPDDAYASDPDHYGALVSGRIRHLTLTLNTMDTALMGYEAQEPTEALGDEAADAPEIQTLLARREALGLTTDIVAHDSADGLGHLGIDPGGSPLVTSLVDEQLDRISTGRPSPQTQVREDVQALVPGRVGIDEVFGAPEMQDYLRDCQHRGVDPDPAEVARIRRELVMDEVEEYSDYGD